MATDNVGRNIDAGMDLSQLKGLIQSLAKSDVGKPKPFKQTASSNEDKILSELKSFAPKFSNSIKKFEGLVESVKKFVSANSGKDAKQSRFGKNAEAADKAMKKLADKGLKKGSIWTHDMYVEKMQKLMYLEMRKQTAVLQNDVAAIRDLEVRINAGRTELDNAAVRESSPSSRFDLKNIGGDTNILALAEIGKYVDDFTDSIGDFQKTIYGFRATEVLFKDLYAAERDFTINTRQIAFEIAGATKESRGLQRSFEDIGRTSAETGFDRSTVQEAYLKALKKGTKEQKTALSITKNQLNTERMIGVSAGTLEDTFTNMSLQMGMNNSQMAQFGRGVQDVAKNTGVTGEHLANAVRSSEGIMKNMRNIGTLNAQAASNVVGLLASAEKFGVGDFAQDLSNTLSQGLSGFIHADSRMQIILGQALGHNAKLFEQMRNGTIMQTKEGMRGVAKGMKDVLANFSNGRVRTMKDFAKLSDQEKMILNTRMKEATGRTAVEFLQIAKSIDEAAEPLSKKLEKIAEQKKKNLNAEEKAALLEQERSLKVSTGLSALTQLDEELQKTDGGIEGMNKALAKLKTSEMAKELEAMNIDTTDAKAMGRATIEQTLKGLNEGLKKVGQSSVDISSDRIEKALSGDSAEYEKIKEELDAGAQKLAAAQKDASDPMTQLRRSMEKLNDTLRGTTQGAISTMMNSVFGESLGFLSTGVDIASQIVGFGVNAMWNYVMLDALMGKIGMDATKIFGAGGPFASFFGTDGFLGKFFNRGAGAAGGAATSVASGAADKAAGAIGGGMEKFGQMLSKLGSNKTIKGAGTIALLGVALMTAAIGFKTFSEVSWEGMFKGSVALIGLIAVARIIGKATTSMVKGAANIAILGSALTISAVGFKTFNEVNWNSLLKGAIAIGVLAFAAKRLGNMTTDIIKGAFAIGTLGAAMWVAGKGFAAFNEVNWDSLLKGIIALGTLGATALLLGNAAQHLVKGAFAIGVLGAAMWFAGKGFAAFNEVNWDSVAKGAASLTVLGVAAFLLSNISGQIILGAVAIGALGAAMWVAGKGFAAFNEVNWDSLLKGAAALVVLTAAIFGLGAIMMTGVGAAVFAAGVVAFVALGAAAAAMGIALGIASLGIKPFAESLKLIGEIDGGNLFAIGGGLASIGAGMIVFSAGMLAATGAGVLSGIASLFGVKSPLDRIKELVPMAFQIALIGEGIKNFGEGIRELNKSVSEFNADAFKKLKDSLSDFSFSGYGDEIKLAAEYLKSMGESQLVSILPTSGGVASTPTESLASASSGSRSTIANTASISQGESIQRDSASAEAPVNKELGEIASASSTQVDQMNQMIALLTQMVNQAGGESEISIINGLGGDMASTMTNSVVTSPPKYYKWSTGKHMQTSALGVSNLANIG